MKVNIIIPPSTWLRALVPAQLKNMLLCISLEEELGPCFITELLLLDCFFFVPAFPCFPEDHWSLRPFQGQASWPGLDHKMAWTKNGFFYVEKAMPGSLSPGTPPSYQLTGFHIPFSPAFSLQSDEPCVPSLIHLWCSKMNSRSLKYYYLEQEAKERKENFTFCNQNAYHISISSQTLLFSLLLMYIFSPLLWSLW